MLVLGIESSCDETSCAIVENGTRILSNYIASQQTLHSQYGGVFPELASREHCQIIDIVLKNSLLQANITTEQIDLIAIANKPGLIGSLTVGVNFSKGLSLGLNKPLISVNHVEAHLHAAIMNPLFTKKISYPSLGLVISGAHTILFYINSKTDFKLIGTTKDDAIGEVFDKVARLLGFPYPGGIHIEKLAQNGDPNKFSFKAGSMKNFPYDFSFSGLKTAVLYELKKHSDVSQKLKQDIAASFQKAAFQALLNRITLLTKNYSFKNLLIGGGVAANESLRFLLQNNLSIPISFADKELCSDNGAMIAGLGYYLFLENKITMEIKPCSRHQWEKHLLTVN